LICWDEKIVDRMKLGEQNAFEQCYRQLSPLIYTAILKICKKRCDANDLLQDTFITAFEKINSYQQETSFIAWLKTIAFNKTFNFLKKEKKLLVGIEHLPEQLSDDSELTTAVEQSNLLLHLFEHIPEMERLILWLYIVEQYSHQEIAQLVNKTPSYSKSLVSRCLKKLRAKHEVNNYAY